MKHHIEFKERTEKEIDEIEEAIKLFSSKKPVYISDENTFSH